MRDWRISLDLNYDGITSITDIKMLLNSIFYYPGDTVIKNAIGTKMGDFFELTIFDYGGTFSATISVFAWILAFTLVSGIVVTLVDQ